MTIGELILRCFHARTTAHVLHLQTRSYAAHKALNDFYDGVIDLADSLAEVYQGAHGLIKFPETPYEPESDGTELLDALHGAVDEFRETLRDEDSHLTNICDEIKALCDSTSYKLNFLK